MFEAEEVLEVFEVIALEEQEPGCQGVDASEELAEGDDPLSDGELRGVGLDHAHGAFEDDQGRVELSSLPFGEDSPEEDPDVGLGAVEFAPMALAVGLVDHPPRDEFAEVHADIASRDAKPLAERIGRPIGPRDVEQGEQLSHGGVDPPRACHDAPMLDELANDLVALSERRRVTECLVIRGGPGLEIVHQP